jgi:hypothetical protein
MTIMHAFERVDRLLVHHVAEDIVLVDNVVSALTPGNSEAALLKQENGAMRPRAFVAA